MRVDIVNLAPDHLEHMRQLADLLLIAFQGLWHKNLEEALDEIQESLEAGRISRIAVDEVGRVLGWIGARPSHDGHAWELHPLVVHPDYQGQGIGRALVADLERMVRERGAVTLYLGTDDLDGRTTLGDTDLYPNVVDHIARIQNLRRHPYEFYQKLGFVLVGVIPDASGPGKPDILMAKRVDGT